MGFMVLSFLLGFRFCRFMGFGISMMVECVECVEIVEGGMTETVEAHTLVNMVCIWVNVALVGLPLP